MDWALSRYAALTFENENKERLGYRFLMPRPYEPCIAYPLVLFLHGAGERGADNTAQCKHALPEFASDELMRRYPCFVIAPQVPEGETWTKDRLEDLLADDAAPAEPARSLRLALEVVAQVRREYTIDPGRIYITGISMGGFGTWDAIGRWPGLFAAAAPICGGGAPAMAPRFAHVPVWAFHGGADPIVPVAQSRRMVEAVRQAGGEPRYTEYSGIEHDSWSRTYRDPAFYAWLFAQRRQGRL